MATDTPKLLYVEVVDGSNGKDNPASEDDSSSSPPSSFRYTRSMLQSTLQLMGCKARHAFKISRRVFDMMRADHLPGNKKLAQLKVSSEVLGGVPAGDDQSCLELKLKEGHSAAVHTDENQSIPYELYKKLTTVIVPRETFLDVVCNALTQYKYVGPNQRADLILACRIRERKESVTILLCGTSGCGKSTLSSLLGSRLGITTVISTDSIRHMMRSFVNEKQNPLLWASTYHAGEHLDPVAVAESKAKRKAKKTAGVAMPHSLDYSSDAVLNPNANSSAIDGDLVSKKLMAIEGYKAQSEMVIDSLDRLITTWEERKESVVVEGVHLSLNFVVGLMKKHPSIIPFMIYITTEDKHMERFAVRAKYMTLDPSKNKYVKYIRNIRTIQEYLCNRADKHLVPKINNTNVDRSVAAIHATVFSCLRRRVAGEQLYDSTTNTVPIIDAEYRNQCAANTLSSKGMFQLIQRKGSFRHLMALVENDGSVAKVWPMESVGENKNIPFEGAEKSLGDPVYDASSIGKAEPVNLQFGSYGISAWPNESCGTSQNGSIDEAIADCGTDAGSRYHSSCCSSPRMSDVPDKEPKEELSVSGSDDEVDDPLGADTDDDLSDTDEKLMQEEMEGSVDEGSTKSDEEYEDLAIRDGTENGYWSDDDESFNSNKKLLQGNGDATASSSVTDAGSKISSDQNKYLHNLDVFLRSSGERLSHDQPCSYSLLSVKGGGVRSADGRFDKARRHSFGDASWLHGHTQGIAALDRKGSTCGLIF